MFRFNRSPRAGAARVRLPRLAAAVMAAFFSQSAPAETVAGQAEAGQRVPLTGVHNLRDLGGYHSADGRVLRTGLLFRSGELSGADAADRARLEALGIRNVCDFRSDQERAQAPDPQLPGWRFDQRCYSVKVAGAGDERFAQLMKAREAGRDIDWAGLLTQFYGAMPDQFAGQYRALFEQLVDRPGEPLLFHCTAGKDRTGIAAALVLLALDVPETTVMLDYLLSNRYVGETTAVPAGLPADLRGIPALAQVRREYLQAALDSIRARYGSVDAYLEQALGLNAERRARLRANLLEPSASPAG